MPFLMSLRALFLAVSLVCAAAASCGQAGDAAGLAAVAGPSVLKVSRESDALVSYIVDVPELFSHQWDTLAQPRFWRRVMCLPAEVSLINLGSTRQILGVMPTSAWSGMDDLRREAFRDSLRRRYFVGAEEPVLVTAGKQHFYRLREVLPSMAKAIPVFLEEGTDPWYAQAILLIESPAQLQKSSAGAYGPFQLMRSVAIAQGLKVNSKVDERADLEKSARGAARLLRRICIPKTRELLAEYGIEYQETDLWFRLLVMHVYHAGYGNVRGVMSQISPTSGGMGLISTLWHTSYRHFKNSSQNYSQLVLAALLELDYIIATEWRYVCEPPRG